MRETCAPSETASAGSCAATRSASRASTASGVFRPCAMSAARAAARITRSSRAVSSALRSVTSGWTSAGYVPLRRAVVPAWTSARSTCSRSIARRLRQITRAPRPRQPRPPTRLRVRGIDRNHDNSARCGRGWVARNAISSTETTSITPRVHKSEPAISCDRNERADFTRPAPETQARQPSGSPRRVPSR